MQHDASVKVLHWNVVDKLDMCQIVNFVPSPYFLVGVLMNVFSWKDTNKYKYRINVVFMIYFTLQQNHTFQKCAVAKSYVL